MEPGVAMAQEEQHQFKSLKEELGRLSTLIEQAQLRLASFAEDEKKYGLLKAALQELTAKLAPLEKAEADLLSKKTALEKEIAGIPLREKQEAALIQKLKTLKERIAAAQSEVEGFAFDTGAAARLKKDIAALSGRHSTLKKSVGEYESRARTATTRLAIVEKQLQPKEEKLKELTDMHDVTKGAHSALLGEVTQLRQEKRDLMQQKREGFKQELQDITKAKEAAQQVLTDLNTAIGTAKKEAQSLQSKRDEYARVCQDVSDAEGQLRTLTEAIGTARGEVKRVSERKEKELQDIDAAWDVFDKKCAARDVQLRLREKDCDEREGTVNRMKGWLETKEIKLKSAKRELEEIHGRELRHIVFE